MSLKLVLGGSGRGKTYYIQHHVIKEAAKNPDRNYIIVVPEQFTLATQKELVSLSKAKGILNIEVQSFLRLAFRIFSETGAGNQPVLDDMGKTMILKKVLLEERDKLSYFGKNVHKEGYIKQIKSFLSELIQYDVNIEKLQDMIDVSGKRHVLKQKLQDMSVAYTAFMRYIKEHYITSEEVLSVFAEVVGESELIKNSVIYLDGYTGFTPLQYPLLTELLKYARDVYVTITIDDKEPIGSPGPKHRLFYMSRKTICHLTRIANENGIEVCKPVCVGRGVKHRFGEAPSLDWLEKNLFRFPTKVYDSEINDISIYCLRQPEDEVAFLVQKIGMLIRDEGCRYRDIAVIAGDLDVYGVLAETALSDAGYACFVDRKKSILTNPFVDMLDAVLDIFLKDFSYSDIMRFLKGKFSGFEPDGVNIFDNFLLASGIRGHKRYSGEWDTDYFFRGKNENAQIYGKNQVNAIRGEIAGRLLPFYDSVKGKHTVNEFAEIFMGFLEDGDFENQMQQAAEEFRKGHDFVGAKEYEQIYATVMGVFERLIALLGEEVMDLKEFKEILEIGFSEARIGLIPPGVDQIVVGDLSRSRLSGAKYLFFLGMNDCNVPKGGGNGGILSDMERNFLAGEEFELAPTDRELVYTEQFYLYLNLTKPSRHLYLTYCEAGNDGKARNASYLIERLYKLFPKLMVQDKGNKADDVWDILSNDKGKQFLIQGLRLGNLSNPKWQELYRYYAENKNILLDRLMSAAFYHKTESRISREAARLLYSDIYRGSTSQLERYSACAFSYFMRYGLRLRERAEHQVEFFDIGNIIHEALELYTKHLIDRGKQWGDLTEDEQHIEANHCLNAAVERYKNGLLYDTERDTYMVARLRRILHRTVWAITEQMRHGKFETVESEFSFDLLERGEVTGDRLGQMLDGSDMAESGAETDDSSDGQTLMHLIGKLDRLDSLDENGKTYIRIVDYKTGKKDLSLSDLYYGLQMQLVIYLKAGMQQAQKGKGDTKLVIPAGVFYYNVDDPILEGKKNPDDAQEGIFKALKLHGIINEDGPVIPAMDKAFETDTGELPASTSSDVIPVETDKNGNLKKKSATFITRDFELIMDFTKKKLLSMGSELLGGNTAINPYKREDSTGKKACDKCAYRGVCRFDARLPENKFRRLKALSDDDVLSKITVELKKEDE